jgi:S-adenosylmethionine-diacylglycerol 3-amino-3-carboxypropyl transferase
LTANLQSQIKDRPFQRHVSYASCWEDPLILQEALQVQSGDNVISICSGGCNSLSLLVYDPAAMTVVDFNPAQIHLVRLKMAAIRTLDHGALLELIGVRDSNRRRGLYEATKTALTSADVAYWDMRLQQIDQGLFRIGRTDKYLMLFGRIIRTLYGRRKLERLFAARDVEAQRELFRREWDGPLWRGLFKAFFHRAVISRAKDPTHFRFVDFDGFGDRFRKRTEWLFTDVPLRDNYFLSLVFLGRYPHERAVPTYLLEENHAIVRDRLDRISFHQGDLETLLNMTPDQTFDRFNLSNLFDWVDDEHLSRALRKVVRTGRPGGRMVYWNTLMPRPLPSVEGLTNHAAEAAEMLKRDRFIYAHFTVADIAPAGTVATAPVVTSHEDLA